MADVPISKELVQLIIPSPNLNDLDNTSNDIENDVNYLLNWLISSDPKTKSIEPSNRVKAAIRNCLKDEDSQLEFTKLYMNSINSNFKTHLKFDDMDLQEIITYIKDVKLYFNTYLMRLNLNPLCEELFQRNLNSLIYTCLKSQCDVAGILWTYLSEHLFEEGEKQEEVLETSAVLSGINMGDELNFIIVGLSIRSIKEYVISNCANVWDKPLLSNIDEYIKTKICPKFNTLVSVTSNNKVYYNNLMKIAHDELVSLRISEIFRIIYNYPDSKVCLYELYHCLSLNQHPHFDERDIVETEENAFSLLKYSLNSKSYQRAKLVETFIQLCCENLLHAGTNTVDVITTYTKTIRSFLIIDPRGVLLDKVVRPIRRYLKTREDIIIKLVHGLLNNDESNELIELARDLRNTSVTHNRGKNGQVDDLVDLKWTPDPIDALPDFKRAKVTDIIESLISIFDSKEIFVDEFTRLFGDRLINLHNYDTREISEQLDLLKMRFGKSEFTTLDIMIRDIRESKISNEIISSEIDSENTNFYSTVLSHLYWPTVFENLEGNEFQIPDIIQKRFSEFNEKYSKYRKGRTLKIVPQLGLVKLQLIQNNKPVSFEVTPEKASVISLFDEITTGLSLDAVASQLKMKPYLASRALQFWVKQDILVEVTRDLYFVNENPEASNVQNIDSGSTISNSATSGDKSDGSDAITGVLKLYIKEMLSNLGELPFDRIRHLLHLTVPKESLNMENVSDIMLEEFLDKLVDSNELAISKGCYRSNH